jgi:hypothetical protein
MRAQVQGHCNQVLTVANAAQENIGMDYIWLEDVSYHDWQRYHDLMRSTSLCRPAPVRD